VSSPEDAVRELKLLGEMPMEEGEWPRYFVGTPSLVKKQLEQMAGELGIGELIVNTIVWDHAKRLRSYELLAAEFERQLVSESASQQVSKLQPLTR
jgi:alkanesulfonate monooxygenase SsuD/methylene tetrahydromethanopterin reductase-like flavin-dependent oxidoreductase (luciferase family)